MSAHRVERVVFNDRLGYAVIYYKPFIGGVKIPRSEDICEHRRHNILKGYDDPLDEKFCDEIEALVRQKERETASKEISHICEKINELYQEVQEQEVKHRDILNDSVKKQIKGKSADDICNILVNDVLLHTKPPVYIKDSFPHKLKSKIHASAVERAPEAKRINPYLKALDEELSSKKNETKSAIDRLEKYMDENIQAEVHGRKYARAIDKIQEDIIRMKRRCTEQINFNY